MSDFFSYLKNTPQNLKESILSHVLILLNTRQGSLLHMPDYGIPEFNCHHGYSRAKKLFITALKEVIERYEPRIHSLIINEVTAERSDCVLQVKLFASFERMDPFELEAMLLSGGAVLVSKC